MIDFKGVSFSFDDKILLDKVDFHMEKGEFVGILGPNGGGKSTFLRLLLGLLKPQEGEIKVNSRSIGYLSQTTSISDISFPCTVEELVGLGLIGKKKWFLSKKDKEKIDAILKEYDLFELRGKLISELSGGQLQRARLAKALVGEPDLIVFDEPDAGMDEENHHRLIETIHRLKEEGKSILFVSHHPHDLENADHIYFIEDGKILTYEEELSRGHHHVSL